MRRVAGEPPKGKPLAVRTRAWTAVREQPDFAVPADNGQCRIDEIPPGHPRAPASHEGEVAVEFELT